MSKLRNQTGARRLATHAWLLLIAIVAGAAGPNAPPAGGSSDALAGLRYKAVLIAGDQSSPAFDHATEAMRDRLLASAVAAADIQKLSAARQNTLETSSLDHVLSAIARLHPGPGEGCLVFATSHGAYQKGLVLIPSENFLTPEALDRALLSGCGNAPTVVIISGCFSGRFAQPPMARANRIVLTAAREDRPSFGCGADSRFTFYDRCLLQTLDRASTWRSAYAMIRTCVTAREKENRFRPSEPQAWFGEAVPGMPIPHPR